MVGGVSAIQVSQRYHPREVRAHGIWETGEWRWKAYSIRHQERAEAGEEFFEWLRLLAMERASAHPPDSTVYGVGFLIAHSGRYGDYALIQWWGDEDMLYNSVYVAPPGDYENFELMTTAGMTACVWELAVIDFERRVWMDTVLKNPSPSSLSDYLACVFNDLI